MKRFLAVVCLLLAGAASGAGLQVFIDGQFAGTLSGSGLTYDISNGTIRIETAEGVLGCELDRIFWDRFEEQTAIGDER